MKRIILWSLGSLFLLGWMLTPGLAIGLNLGLFRVQIQLLNPIPSVIELYNYINPPQLSKIDQEIAALDKRQHSPWPKDSVAMYKQKV